MHRARHRASQFAIKPVLHTIGIHGGQQNFAGAKFDHFTRVIDRIDTGRITAAMRKNLPTWRLAGLCHALRVDRNHDTLIAEFFRGFLDEFAPCHRCRIDRNLVGARSQQHADVIDGAYAAANGERHETGFRRAPDHVEHDTAVLMARSDVEKGELVGAGAVISDGGGNRIAVLAASHGVDTGAIAIKLARSLAEDARVALVGLGAAGASAALEARAARLLEATIQVGRGGIREGVLLEALRG